jgi:hypothetical protein
MWITYAFINKLKIEQGQRKLTMSTSLIKKITFLLLFATAGVLNSCIFLSSDDKYEIVNSLYGIGAGTYGAKRGMCYEGMNSAEMTALASGSVTWAYNWTEDPYRKNNSSVDSQIGPGRELEFVPMVWGGTFDEVKLRSYLDSHTGVKYLLGFNEPMMTGTYGGCALSPADAAALWPAVEQIADDYDLSLVSPALTYGFEQIDGTVYATPESWMDTFIMAYQTANDREPRFDYLALHSYMDYPSAVLGFCDRYAEMYGKKIFLTEFCAWSANETPHLSLSGQITTMTQKIEALDQDDNVAGYAWFMSHGNVTSVPYNSIFESYDGDGNLTELGKIYCYMSDHNTGKWYAEGDVIPAASYVSSSNYNTGVGTEASDGLRYNAELNIGCCTDTGGKTVLEIGRFTSGRFANYQIVVDFSGTYTLTLRFLSDNEQKFEAFVDNSTVGSSKLGSTGSTWKTASFTVDLAAGRQILQIASAGDADTVKLGWLEFDRQ